MLECYSSFQLLARIKARKNLEGFIKGRREEEENPRTRKNDFQKNWATMKSVTLLLPFLFFVGGFLLSFSLQTNPSDANLPVPKGLEHLLDPSWPHSTVQPGSDPLVAFHQISRSFESQNTGLQRNFRERIDRATAAEKVEDIVRTQKIV